MRKPKPTPGKSRKPARAPKPPRLSRLSPPQDMTLPDWQIGLRRQFGQEQAFVLDNLGSDPVFSDFRVGNPDSGGRYLVTLRGTEPGSNRCTCADYATNELGTCKHIEFVLSNLSRRREARRALRAGYRPEFSELWLHYGAQRSLRLRPGTAMPPALRTQAQALFETADGWRLPPTRYGKLDSFLAQAEKLRHPLRIANEATAFLARLREDAQRRERLRALYPRGAADPAFDTLLREPLFPYQAEGALFATAAGRALIADEMGLGKTIQAIAACELWRRHFDAARVLVVCPTSLKAQWAHELQRFAGHEPLIVEGNAGERACQYAAPAICKIASYDSLVRDFDYANAWKPDVLIVDEAQRIKNWDTRAARALKRLDSRFAVVLTGTPLENKLEELLSVVQLVDRHRLGPTWRFLHEHQIRDDSGRVTGYRNLDRIGQTLAPILIRRRKNEVLTQLPARRDERLLVPLTPLQRALHDEQADLVAQIVHRWRRTRHLSDADQKRLQAAMQKMRMACNSSYLLDRETDQGEKITELLAWLLPRLAESGSKAVVFSAWLATHELIAAALDAQDLGYVHFNGSVPARERARRVEQFRSDPACRVFLATDAGGVGLNLQQTASIIVNMDMPWNPAVLEQRIGRVWRLGQQQRVEVLNLVASDSIEQNMLGVLQFKRSLFEGVLEGGEGEVRLEGTKLSRFMQSVEALTGAEAPAPAESTNAASAAIEDLGASIAASQTRMDISVEPAATSIAGAETDASGATTSSSAGDPAAALQPLLHAAAQWLGQLASAAGNGGAHPLIERDPMTGRASLRLPLPEPGLLRTLADALEAKT